MAIVVVRDDRRRVVAHIRVHGERLVDVTQTRRWTFTDVRLVVAELSRLADRHEPVGEATGLVGVSAAAPEPVFTTTTTAATVIPVSHGGRPPMRGPGSSRAAWLDYARSKDVQVSGTMSRDDIAAAVQDHEAALSGV